MKGLPLLLLLFNQQSLCGFSWVGQQHSALNQIGSRRHIFTPSHSLSVSSVTMEKEATNAPFPGVNLARQLYSHWNVLYNGTLQVDSVHTLSYQILGSSTPTSVDTNLVGLFLHGGPGAGCFPNHARFFDPRRYHRVALLDQRGCGKSTPRGCLTDNTLLDLVEDCEKLKTHLQLPQWDVVLGGSWGTTVAIAYSQCYPASVRAMILRGVFLFRPQEVDWLFSSSGGAAKKYETVYRSFCDAVDVSQQVDPSSARLALHEHTRRLWEAPTEGERNEAARSWMQWEYFNSVAHKIPPSANLSDPNSTMQAIRSWEPPEMPPVVVYQRGNTESDGVWAYQSIDQKVMPREVLSSDLLDAMDNRAIQTKFRVGISDGYQGDDPPRDTFPITAPTIPYYTENGSSKKSKDVRLPIQAMLTSFYSSNCDWCRNYVDLLDDNRMDRLKGIPTIIVQGASDGICPPDSALDLLNAWPMGASVELRMPIHGGHSMYDPLVRNEVLWAADRMADRLTDMDATRKGRVGDDETLS